MTKIPYLDETWNPVVGCKPCSPGCENCYARRLHGRRHSAWLAGARLPAQYAEPFSTVRCLKERLAQPAHWRKPRAVGVNFMSDTFHDAVPGAFLDGMFETMRDTPRHIYLLLTKRPARMCEYVTGYCRKLRWPHVWLCVSVWDQDSADRNIPCLMATPAAQRGVSYEPALGPVDFTPYLGPHQIDWLVMGCESGPGRRLPQCASCGGEGCPACAGSGYAVWQWARQARDACQVAAVPFYLKQLPACGGRVLHLPELDGRQHLALPWRRGEDA